MRRITCVALFALAVAGCGKDFATEAEELAYLSSLSNPTPSQWRTRTKLQAKQAEIQAKLKAESDSKKRIRDAEALRLREARQAKEDSEKVDKWMVMAKNYESKTIWTLAISYYEDVITKYPKSPRRKEAEARLEACKAKESNP